MVPYRVTRDADYACMCILLRNNIITGTYVHTTVPNHAVDRRHADMNIIVFSIRIHDEP